MTGVGVELDNPTPEIIVSATTAEMKPILSFERPLRSTKPHLQHLAHSDKPYYCITDPLSIPYAGRWALTRD
jgi:hypothetical protein